MNYSKISLEQIKSEVSIIVFGEMYYGLTPKCNGNYYGFKEISSLKVKKNTNYFKRYSAKGNNYYGSIIDFVINMESVINGISFSERDAIALIKKVWYNESLYIPYNHKYQLSHDDKADESKKQLEADQTDFKLPKPYKYSNGKFRKKEVYDFLVDQRKIDPKIVKYIDNRKLFYQEKSLGANKFYYNAIFLGYKNNKVVYAVKQAIDGSPFKIDIKGSNYSHGFFINNTDKGSSIIVTEAIYDTLSMMNILMLNNENYGKYSHLALTGVDKVSTLFNILNDYLFEINEVLIAVDNDESGEKCKNMIFQWAKENNWHGKVKDVRYIFKDFKDANDYLKNLKG